MLAPPRTGDEDGVNRTCERRQQTHELLGRTYSGIFTFGACTPVPNQSSPNDRPACATGLPKICPKVVIASCSDVSTAPGLAASEANETSNDGQARGLDFTRELWPARQQWREFPSHGLPLHFPVRSAAQEFRRQLASIIQSSCHPFLTDRPCPGWLCREETA